MTDETSDDDATRIELRPAVRGWEVTDTDGVEAEVAKAMVDGLGNARLTVNLQPE